MTSEVRPGNVGIVTTTDNELCEVTSCQNGLVYCLPMTAPKVLRVCLPWHFWVLLDKMPD
jgi:hypothetical protein